MTRRQRDEGQRPLMMMIELDLIKAAGTQNRRERLGQERMDVRPRSTSSTERATHARGDQSSPATQSRVIEGTTQIPIKQAISCGSAAKADPRALHDLHIWLKVGGWRFPEPLASSSRECEPTRFCLCRAAAKCRRLAENGCVGLGEDWCDPTTYLKSTPECWWI